MLNCILFTLLIVIPGALAAGNYTRRNIPGTPSCDLHQTSWLYDSVESYLIFLLDNRPTSTIQGILSSWKNLAEPEISNLRESPANPVIGIADFLLHGRLWDVFPKILPSLKIFHDSPLMLKSLVECAVTSASRLAYSSEKERDALQQRFGPDDFQNFLTAAQDRSSLAGSAMLGAASAEYPFAALETLNKLSELTGLWNQFVNSFLTHREREQLDALLQETKRILLSIGMEDISVANLLQLISETQDMKRFAANVEKMWEDPSTIPAVFAEIFSQSPLSQILTRMYAIAQKGVKQGIVRLSKLDLAAFIPTKYIFIATDMFGTTKIERIVDVDISFSSAYPAQVKEAITKSIAHPTLDVWKAYVAGLWDKECLRYELCVANRQHGTGAGKRPTLRGRTAQIASLFISWIASQSETDSETIENIKLYLEAIKHGSALGDCDELFPRCVKRKSRDEL